MVWFCFWVRFSEMGSPRRAGKITPHINAIGVEHVCSGLLSLWRLHFVLLCMRSKWLLPPTMWVYVVALRCLLSVLCSSLRCVRAAFCFVSLCALLKSSISIPSLHLISIPHVSHMIYKRVYVCIYLRTVGDGALKWLPESAARRVCAHWHPSGMPSR